MEGELVPRIGGGANGAKGGKKYVERGKMVQRELGFLGWDGRKGCAFVEATLLEPIECVSP